MIVGHELKNLAAESLKKRVHVHLGQYFAAAYLKIDSNRENDDTLIL